MIELYWFTDTTNNADSSDLNDQDNFRDRHRVTQVHKMNRPYNHHYNALTASNSRYDGHFGTTCCGEKQ